MSLARSAVVTFPWTVPPGKYGGQSHSGQPLGSLSTRPAITQRLTSFDFVSSLYVSPSMTRPVSSLILPLYSSVMFSQRRRRALGEFVESLGLKVVSSRINFSSLAKLEPTYMPSCVRQTL